MIINMENSIKSNVMRRVYMIWFLRRAFSPLAVKGYFVLALLWQLGERVWVRQIIANAPNATDIEASYHFVFGAFSSTELAVRLISLGIITIGVWFIVDVVRNFSRSIDSYALGAK